MDIERTDSGVGSESSQASSSRGAARRWRNCNATSNAETIVNGVPQISSNNKRLCEDCEQHLDPLITDRYNNIVYMRATDCCEVNRFI